MRRASRLAMVMRLADGVNPYLNTPPTELVKALKSEKDKTERKLMRAALRAMKSQTSFGADDSTPQNVPSSLIPGAAATGQGMSQRRLP